MNATASPDEIETALRAELRARTAPLAVDEVPFARLEAASRRDRIRRRTLLGTTAALALALVAASAAAGALGGGGGTGQMPAGGGGTSLAAIPPRGNLVGDTAFIQAVTEHYLGKSSLLYANDDGTHTVVIGIGGTFPRPWPSKLPGPVPTGLIVLVGPHDAQVGQLTREGPSGVDLTGRTSLTFIGGFHGDGESVPYVVLGPTNMTHVEYATGVQLRDEDGKLVPVRTGVTSAPVTDGVAAGEIQGPTTVDGAFRLSMQLVWRGSTSDGTALNVDSGARGSSLGPEDQPPTDASYDAIREAVVNKARQDGVIVAEHGPGGDEVTDNAALVLSDLALLAGVNPGSISYSVDWVGRETAQWDSALIEFDAPGLPKIQAFIRGLAPGRPDSDSPGLDLSYVRPAVPLTAGRFPTTEAEFGGTPEFTTIGKGLLTQW